MISKSTAVTAATAGTQMDLQHDEPLQNEHATSPDFEEYFDAEEGGDEYADAVSYLEEGIDAIEDDDSGPIDPLGSTFAALDPDTAAEMVASEAEAANVPLPLPLPFRPSFWGHDSRLRALFETGLAVIAKPLEYYRQWTVCRERIEYGNPALKTVQDTLLTRFLFNAKVAGFTAPGVTPERCRIDSCCDIGASSSGWWTGPFKAVNQIIGTFHEHLNSMRAEMKFLAIGDTTNSSTLARLCDFGSLVAQQTFLAVADAHKGVESLQVTMTAMLYHMVQMAIDNAPLDFPAIDDPTCAEHVRDWILTATGGGPNFRHMRAVLFDISLPRYCMYCSWKRGIYGAYFAARLYFLDAAFASGMTGYAPAILFDVIRRLHLYSAEMKKWHDLFFVMKTRKEHNEGAPFKGIDESTEGSVKEFRGALFSGTRMVSVADISFFTTWEENNL
jgi:hypothetical protein